MTMPTYSPDDSDDQDDEQEQAGGHRPADGISSEHIPSIHNYHDDEDEEQDDDPPNHPDSLPMDYDPNDDEE